MPRQDKYYVTNIIIYGDKLKKLINLGYKGTHAQFKVVCKAKSMAEANRIAESYGLSNKCFTRSFTSETGNAYSIEMADKYGFIVAVDGTLGKEYVGIDSVI